MLLFIYFFSISLVMLCDSAKEKPARMTIVASRPHYSQLNLTGPKVIVASKKIPILSFARVSKFWV